MHRIDTPTAQTDKFGAGKNGFTRGNPQTGVPATALDDDYFDAIQEEIAVVVESSGVSLDKGNKTQLLTALKKLFLRTSNNFSEIAAAGSAAVTSALANLGLSDVAHLPQLTGIVGTSRNARMFVPSASATATFTADELIVQASLGGRQYKVSSFSKVINLATTGAGGMDIGTAPVNGYIALYAIYNPTTQVSALLAVNATTIAAPEIYGGANMPNGYTASALVSVWPTNASNQFIVGYLNGRDLIFTNQVVVNSSSAPATLSQLSLASVVPLNAKTMIASGRIQAAGGSGVIGFVVTSDSQQIGRAAGGGYTASSVAIDNPTFNITLITRQQCYYYVSITAVTSYLFSLYISGYSI